MNVPSRARSVGSAALPALGRWVVIAAAMSATAQAGCASRRVADGPPLQLHQGYWSPKFSYNDPAQYSVFDWHKLDTAFVAVVARNPAALDEARRATPFRTAAIVAYAGGFAFAIKGVVSATTEDVTFDQIESVNSDLIWSLGLSVGAFVFEQLAERHVRRSVSRFNLDVTTGSRGGERLPGWFLQTVRNAAFAPSLDEAGIRVVAGTAIRLR